jgi:hypothetical protein
VTCSTCGTPNPPGAVGCLRCGAALPVGAPSWPAGPSPAFPPVAWVTPTPTPGPSRRWWPWLVAAAVVVLLAAGGATTYLLLRTDTPAPETIARGLEALRADAWAAQDADELRRYYADPAEADAESEGFYSGARVQVLDVDVVTADDERIVAHVVTREPAGEGEDPFEYEGDVTYELVSVGDGDEAWRVTDVEVPDE